MIGVANRMKIRNNYNKAQVAKLPPAYDRRRKLTEADKAQIKRLHSQGIAIREIARRYANKCTRRAIQFVLFPERLETVNYPGHWKKYRPSKKEWAETIKEHRHYKKYVYNKLNQTKGR